MSNVLISIASQLDNKGFKQADFSIKSLTKSVAKLSGGILTLQKAQQAMFAYMADEKATNVLAQNLKNLGLGFATQSAEEFISVLQKQTGVLDDELRPAYAQLARVTGSTIETQKLMALAFDVSAGTGTDYTQVIDALSQAYVGNNKGLKSLNIGLSQADLKTKSFADITAILNKQFAGSGDASLDSYAGKMALLQVAASDASETIGKGLLDAISTASGPNGFPAFIKGIEKAAQVITDVVTGTGRLIALIDIAASPSKGIGDILKKYRALRQQWEREDLAVQKQRSGIANNTSSYMQKQAKDALTTAKISAIQKKLDADRLAAAKKLTTEKQKQVLLDKANALVAKAKSEFDLEGIQLAAALMNKSLSAEEVRRLEIKQKIWEIEQAQAAGDLALLETLLKQLEALMKQQSQMAELLKATNQLKALFDLIGFDKELIDTLNLKEALELLKQIQAIKFATVSGGTALQGTGFGGVSPYDVIAYSNAITSVNPDMPVFYEGFSGFSGSDPNTAGNIAGGDIYVTAIVEGNVMSQYDLATAIREQIQDAQQSGKPVNWARQALPATFL